MTSLGFFIEASLGNSIAEHGRVGFAPACTAMQMTDASDEMLVGCAYGCRSAPLAVQKARTVRCPAPCWGAVPAAGASSRCICAMAAHKAKTRTVQTVRVLGATARGAVEPCLLRSPVAIRCARAAATASARTAVRSCMLTVRAAWSATGPGEAGQCGMAFGAHFGAAAGGLDAGLEVGAVLVAIEFGGLCADRGKSGNSGDGENACGVHDGVLSNVLCGSAGRRSHRVLRAVSVSRLSEFVSSMG